MMEMVVGGVLGMVYGLGAGVLFKTGMDMGVGKRPALVISFGWPIVVPVAMAIGWMEMRG